MAAQFHPLLVANIERNTPTCVILTLSIPEQLFKDFQFTQGQYLTLRAEINGEKVQRSYSLCSSPNDREWKVGIKKVPEGKFSTYANEVLKVGDTIEVMPPQGKFFVEVDNEGERNFVAFAAGSGITPLCSIIKTHLEEEPKCSFKLFYINQTAQSVILKEELEALKNQYLDRFEVYYFLTREYRQVPLLNGRLNEEKLDTIFDSICSLPEIDHFFTCGPEAMIFMVRDYLTAKGVGEKQIHFELFTTGDQKTEERKAIAKQHVGEQSAISILEGGKSFNFQMDRGAQSILDGAMNNGADLPYACKGGVCCTCRAKLVEGDVKMLIHYGLEPEEMEAGYVLTCQAIPTSEKVVVDFDQ